MKNILVIRIDDRLIHGQVVTAWIKQYPINKILIIDDELSRNKLMERIYKAAAPVGDIFKRGAPGQGTHHGTCKGAAGAGTPASVRRGI